MPMKTNRTSKFPFINYPEIKMPKNLFYSLKFKERKQVNIFLKIDFFLTTMTIMKTVIGVGVLGLPKVMQNLGWVLGLLIFACTSFLNQYSCIILLKVKNLSHHSNYSTIGYYIFRSKWFQAYTYFLILFNNFGVCKIYFY